MIVRCENCFYDISYDVCHGVGPFEFM